MASEIFNIFLHSLQINELVMKRQNLLAKMADAFRNCGCAVSRKLNFYCLEVAKYKFFCCLQTLITTVEMVSWITHENCNYS